MILDVRVCSSRLPPFSSTFLRYSCTSGVASGANPVGANPACHARRGGDQDNTKQEDMKTNANPYKVRGGQGKDGVTWARKTRKTRGGGAHQKTSIQGDGDGMRQGTIREATRGVELRTKTWERTAGKQRRQGHQRGRTRERNTKPEREENNTSTNRCLTHPPFHLIVIPA